jgi:hypothetical protein
MQKILFLFLFALAGMTSRAQDPRRHRDTLHFGGGGLPEIMKAPVLTGRSQPIIIVPRQQPLCFDKELDLKMSLHGRMMEQTVYLDPEKGLTGILPPSPGGGAVTDIMPEIETFNFIVMSMKGNIYIYKNSKGKNGIDHFVSTSNTQTYLYQSPERQAVGAAGPLIRKAVNRSYCGGQILATAYKFDGGESTWYVYGDRYPAQLHPVKYLGAFGVGYLFCQEGLYLIMELEFTNSFVRIGNMYNMHACFDPSEFVVMEDRFQQQQQENIARERQKNDEEAAKVTGDCAAEKIAVINYKQALNDRHAEIMRKVQGGNMYNDTAAQRAMLSLNDPESSCQLGILQAQQSICACRADMGKHPDRAAALGNKINCLQQQISVLQDGISRMQALDRQYPSGGANLARANAEKSRLYYQLLSTMPHCD